MFGRIWNFVKRHKKKFIFTGVVVGGVTLLWRYAKKKLLDIQELEAEECLMQARRQHHFDSNQRTCNMTVLSMLPKLKQTVMKNLDSETLTAQLKNKPANKIEIWEELKILSFARSMFAVYSVSLLVVFLRVQLNVLGGYMYLDSFYNKENSGSDCSKATDDVQKRYLALIQHLTEKGFPDITRLLYQAVSTHLGDVSLKHQMSLSDIQRVVAMVREEVEIHHGNGFTGNNAPSRLIQHLLPSDGSESQGCGMTQADVVFHQLHTETKDMLESPDFTSVLNACLDTGFTRMVDKLAEYFRPSPAEGDSVPNINQLSMPLAKIVPILNGLVHSLLSDPPNTFVQELLLKEQVKDFAANVYEAFSQIPPSQS